MDGRSVAYLNWITKVREDTGGNLADYWNLDGTYGGTYEALNGGGRELNTAIALMAAGYFGGGALNSAVNGAGAAGGMTASQQAAMMAANGMTDAEIAAALGAEGAKAAGLSGVTGGTAAAAGGAGNLATMTDAAKTASAPARASISIARGPSNSPSTSTAVRIAFKSAAASPAFARNSVLIRLEYSICVR